MAWTFDKILLEYPIDCVYLGWFQGTCRARVFCGQHSWQYAVLYLAVLLVSILEQRPGLFHIWSSHCTTNPFPI